ncbi:hypothetical protein UlMin_005237 [Ulmus minor]
MDFSVLNPFQNTLVAGFLGLVLFVSVYFLRKREFKGELPPEAKGRWPIFGHLHLLGGTNPPYLNLAAMADKYGPIFTLRLGSHPALVVSSAEVAKECFTTNDLACADRPGSLVGKHLGYDYSNFAFAPYGDLWREIRKIAMVELLSNRRLELLKPNRIYEVSLFLKELHKHWSSKKDSSGFVSVEMKQRLFDLTLNVILKDVVGKRYSVESDNSQDQAKVRNIQKALHEFFRLIGVFAPGEALPYLRWLDLGGHEKAMKRTAKQLGVILDEWLDEHKKRRSLGEKEKDVMDVLLRVLEGVNLGGYEADTVNKSTILTFVAGGSDTSSINLTWALSFLLNNRDALKRVQEELDTHIGRDRIVSDTDISKLEYLQAVVKESLRLCPSGPLSAPHEFAKDATIKGYHIPKGTRLITNLYKIQTDPRYWPDALEFKPERFLTTHKHVDLRGQHFEFIPFGSGRRVCPGISSGLQMMHFTLARFLQAFEVTTPGNAPVDMTGSFGTMNVKAKPLEVLIKPRLANELFN